MPKETFPFLSRRNYVTATTIVYITRAPLASVDERAAGNSRGEGRPTGSTVRDRKKWWTSDGADVGLPGNQFSFDEPRFGPAMMKFLREFASSLIIPSNR